MALRHVNNKWVLPNQLVLLMLCNYSMVVVLSDDRLLCLAERWCEMFSVCVLHLGLNCRGCWLLNNVCHDAVQPTLAAALLRLLVTAWVLLSILTWYGGDSCDSWVGDLLFRFFVPICEDLTKSEVSLELYFFCDIWCFFQGREDF
jgi:hypothetical protein